MPSFFAFQQGTESRRHHSQSDHTPLLGRFRAVPDSSNRRNRRDSLNLFGSFSAGRSLGRSIDAVFGSGEDDESVVGDDAGRWRSWWRWQKELWLEPKERAVARAVDRWWGRWWVLVGLPAALVSQGECCGMMLRWLILGGLGCYMVRDTISSVRLDGRQRWVESIATWFKAV